MLTLVSINTRTAAAQSHLAAEDELYLVQHMCRGHDGRYAASETQTTGDSPTFAQAMSEHVLRELHAKRFMQLIVYEQLSVGLIAHVLGGGRSEKRVQDVRHGGPLAGVCLDAALDQVRHLQKPTGS